MSKQTLDYFTPVPRARPRLGLGSLVLGMLACGLVAVPYVVGSRQSLLSLPVAIVAAVFGICTALDAEDLDRRFTSRARFVGLAVCNLAVVAAVVTMIAVAPFL